MNCDMDKDHSTEFSTNENEDFDKTDTGFFNKIKEDAVTYDNEFIKNNFYPLKFSKIDIKNLSSDFTDQTLGGHREYREEIIDGRLAKVYIYKVKVIKYDDEYVSVERKSTGLANTPLIIVENNLIMPCNISLVKSRAISLTEKLPDIPYDGENLRTYKRGRPRKYPVGEEPYKKRRTHEKYFEVVPKTERRLNRLDYNADSFDSEYSNMDMRSNEYFDFTAPVATNNSKYKEKSFLDSNEHFDFDEYLRKMSSPKEQKENTTKEKKENTSRIFKIDNYIK